MGRERRDGQLVRVVEEDVLLAWWRDRMENNPVSQNRIRSKKREPSAQLTPGS